MIEYYPGSMYSGCPLYYQALQINIYNPKIITSTIPTIIYNMSSYSSFTVPLTDFTNDKMITGDSKLNI